MEEHPANQEYQQPLLANQRRKGGLLLLSSVKWVLKIVMWIVFIAWIVLVFLYPLNSVNEWVKELSNETVGTFLGTEGAAFLIFSGPILVIAFLSVPYIIISRKQLLQLYHEKKSRKYDPNYRLSTFPVVVEGPIGVVSVAELIGILMFIFFVIWAVFVYVLRDLKVLEGIESATKTKISSMLQLFGFSAGLIGIFCLAFLFLPISRGSILLRLIDVPFGHAVRYHVWLGHLTMTIFTIHGLLYIIGWSIDGTLQQNILKWPESGVANLAGVIGLLAGLLMWVTSFPPVRKHYFEVFYYTHHFYIIFVIFLALHVGVITFSIIAGSVFLFMLDRFLRFCQSQKTGDIISATCFPSGIIKLVLSKPKHLQYNALSFIFLRVKEVSRLQWHTFSVSSSSLDGDQTHLSVFVKSLGGWTAKITENFSRICRVDQSQEELHLQPQFNVEGPYGHELPHHLMYQKLVLIAGGVGIAPFLAVLSDIVHHVSQGKACTLNDVLIVWAVKRSNELSLLAKTNMNSILSYLSNEVNLKVFVYITQESEPHSLEEGRNDHDNIVEKSFACPLSNRREMSGLVGTGNNIVWSGIYLISTTIGFLILVALLNSFYINPYDIPTGWFHGLLFLACMVASVFIFGGTVVGLWHLWEIKFSQVISCEDLCQHYEPEPETQNDLSQFLASSTAIQYGTRPNFKDILESIQGHVDVGVIVCGPPTLESSVAKECRSLNLSRKRNQPIFHFHSHNFHL